MAGHFHQKRNDRCLFFVKNPWIQFLGVTPGVRHHVPHQAAIFRAADGNTKPLHQRCILRDTDGERFKLLLCSRCPEMADHLRQNHSDRRAFLERDRRIQFLGVLVTSAMTSPAIPSRRPHETAASALRFPRHGWRSVQAPCLFPTCAENIREDGPVQKCSARFAIRRLFVWVCRG